MLRRLSSHPTWHVLPLAICLLPSIATAADSARECAAVSDDRARLACYDGIFGKPAVTHPDAAPGVSSPTAGPAVAGVTAPTVAETVTDSSSPEDDFGLTEAAKRARDPEQAKEQMAQSITAEVASVRRKPTGELVVTLANGQVWSQLQVETRAKVSAGDTVTIKKAALGSYLLVTSSKVATHVRRIR